MAVDKGKINSIFKLNGLILQRDANNVLYECFQNIPQEEHKTFTEGIVEQLQKQNLDSPLIATSSITQAINDVQKQSRGQGSEKSFTAIDAFAIPKFTYHQERKQFFRTPDHPKPLHGDANAKAAVFLNRYTIIQQRLQRHALFQPAIPGRPMDEQGDKFQLKPVEFLLGCATTVGDLIVLGMISQLKEGKYFLEDPTGAVKLDLSETKFRSGFFTECSFVLAEGYYEDGVFHVKNLGFPPMETAETTRTCFGNINFFGGASEKCVKSSLKLQKIESSNPNASIVFIADVWLDDSKVMQRLRRLFSGFSNYPPNCFVFMGNFTAVQEIGWKCSEKKSLSDYFCDLANMILEFPTLVKGSKFVFVPGPLDPILTTILPRPPIPLIFTEGIRQKLPGAFFTTNPCRIQYCTQEIVVIREDLVTKLCRNCLHFPTEEDVPTNFAKTLASQVHLCPLPLHVTPVYWQYDHALYLYPLPDVVVCADKFYPFTVNQADCIFTNPGSFSRNNYVFKVYVPASREMEDSRIMDD